MLSQSTMPHGMSFQASKINRIRTMMPLAAYRAIPMLWSPHRPHSSPRSATCTPGPPPLGLQLMPKQRWTTRVCILFCWCAAWQPFMSRGHGVCTACLCAQPVAGCIRICHDDGFSAGTGGEACACMDGLMRPGVLPCLYTTHLCSKLLPQHTQLLLVHCIRGQQRGSWWGLLLVRGSGRQSHNMLA